MTDRTTLKPAEEIRVGDAIVFLGREHRVANIDDYQGPLADVAFATARGADGWVITLCHGGLVEVAR
jgi:hypothetical protein